MSARRYDTYRWGVALLVMAVFYLGACNKKLKLPDVGGERKIAVLGELVANDSMYLRTGLSVPVKGSESLKFGIVDNMSVVLEDNSGVKTALLGYMDDDVAMLSTTPFSSAATIKDGSIYKVKAAHPVLGVAEATVQVPPKFTAEVVSLNHIKYQGDSMLEATIRIHDPSGAQNYYSIEALKQSMMVDGYFLYKGEWLNILYNWFTYENEKATGSLVTRFDTTYYKLYTRQAIYSSDSNTEYVIAKGTQVPNRRILLRDTRFNGSVYTTRVLIKKGLQLYSSYYDKGRVLLQVKAIPEDYFRYLKGYDEQAQSAAVPYNQLSQPIKVEGNIKNGVGMVGGVYKNEFVVLHDTWVY